jgi:hypothetical protein
VVRNDDVNCHVLHLVTKSVDEYRNNLIKYVTTSTVLIAVHGADSRRPENAKITRILSSTVIIIIDGYSVMSGIQKFATIIGSF